MINDIIEQLSRQESIAEAFDAWVKFNQLRFAWLEMKKHVKAVNEEIKQADGRKTNESCNAWPAFVAAFNRYRELEEKYYNS